MKIILGINQFVAVVLVLWGTVVVLIFLDTGSHYVVQSALELIR